MSRIKVDETILAKHEALADHDQAIGEQCDKFRVAKQYDAITENIEVENYLELDVLADTLMTIAYDYYHGCPAQTDEEEYVEWAYAKNVYDMARYAKAMQLDMSDVDDKTNAQEYFNGLKYAYLLHRIYELRELLASVMGRWGFSDLWGCLNRLIERIEQLHKEANPGKKLNIMKRFKANMARLKLLGLDEAAVRDSLIESVAPLYQSFWQTELDRLVTYNG